MTCQALVAILSTTPTSKQVFKNLEKNDNNPGRLQASRKVETKLNLFQASTSSSRVLVSLQFKLHVRIAFGREHLHCSTVCVLRLLQTGVHVSHNFPSFFNPVSLFLCFSSAFFYIDSHIHNYLLTCVSGAR